MCCAVHLAALLCNGWAEACPGQKMQAINEVQQRRNGKETENHRRSRACYQRHCLLCYPKLYFFLRPASQPASCLVEGNAGNQEGTIVERRGWFIAVRRNLRQCWCRSVLGVRECTLLMVSCWASWLQQLHQRCSHCPGRLALGGSGPRAGSAGCSHCCHGRCAGVSGWQQPL